MRNSAQLFDFFLRGTVLKRIFQGFLGLAQTLFGCRQVSVLNAKCHLPHIVDRIAQGIITSGETKTCANRDQTQIMGCVLDGFFRAKRDCRQHVQHVVALRRIEREDAALLCDGTGKRDC